LNGVAALALATICSPGKLSRVRIGLVAIGTEIVRNRGLEIRVRMALHAPDLLVLSFQREVRLRVIEGGSEYRLLPCHRRVAGIASLFERTLVRIDSVAISAIGKRQSCVSRLTIFCRSMAALAEDVAMFSGQGEARL